MRERIRISNQGPDIVESGAIDFNQFIYWGLVRHFRSLGYSRVLDHVDYSDPGAASSRSSVRTLALRAAKVLPPLKIGARLFVPDNSFICVK